MKPKVIFFGQDWRSTIVLKKLIKSGRFEIAATVPDPSSIIRTIKKSPRAEVGILASFGAKVPKKIIDFFPKGILVVHPSLLPKYRGAKPTAWTILNGDEESGVTIIKITEEFDQGPIVSQVREKVSPQDTAESLEKRLFEIGGETLVNILPDYCKGKIKVRPQPDKNATPAPKLNKNQAKIDWKKTPKEIDRLVRAFDPWPGAWTLLLPHSRDSEGQAKRLKILKAHVENDKLILDLVQLESKKPVTWKQFCEGYPEAKIIKQ